MLVNVTGTGATLGRAIHVSRIAGGRASYPAARRTCGKVLLLALELPMVVRTILSFATQIGMEGDLPWRVGRPGHRAGRCDVRPDRDPHEGDRTPGRRTPDHRIGEYPMSES